MDVGDAVTGHVEHRRQFGVLGDLVDVGDPELVGGLDVDHDSLEATGLHLHADGGDVVLDRVVGVDVLEVVQRLPALGPEVEVTLGEGREERGRIDLAARRIVHLVAEFGHQLVVDGRLHVAGRPVGPSLGHRNTRSGLLAARHLGGVVTAGSGVGRVGIGAAGGCGQSEGGQQRQKAPEGLALHVGVPLPVCLRVRVRGVGHGAGTSAGSTAMSSSSVTAERSMARPSSVWIAPHTTERW